MAGLDKKGEEGYLKIRLAVNTKKVDHLHVTFEG